MNDGGIHVTPSPASFERRLNYLDRVGEHLRMPDERRDEVLEEIATHLDDAIDALMDEGLSIEQAEREAMARLGSPDELGDELRRTHQTTKRLLAAVGGSVWQGLQGGVTGYLVGGLLVAPVVMLLASLVDQLAMAMRGFGVAAGQETYAVYAPIALAAGAWYAARRTVRAYADRSWRIDRDVRGRVGLVGSLVLLVPVLLVPADQVWVSVVATLTIPVAFLVAALTAGGRQDGRPWVPERLSRRLPRRNVLLVVGLVGGFAAIAASNLAIAALAPPLPAPSSVDPGSPGYWTASGYEAVAPWHVLDDGSVMRADFPREGWTVAVLSNDKVDWDAWPGLRLEAWRSSSHRNGPTPETLVDPEDGPYLVVPVDDPWATPRVAVNVGRPGASGYLLFLVAQDPVTGARTVIGHPEGDDTLFHGSMLDWFGAL